MVHPIVARLLTLSFGACVLKGCKTVCSTPTFESPRSFDALSPEVVAQLYASSDLKTVTRVLPRESCNSVCGREATRCEVVVTAEGPEGRPTKMVGRT